MSHVHLTKRIEFSASHRYHNEAWDDVRNRAVFGACDYAPGHGHNYLLEVTVAGTVAESTGMVVNLYDLKAVLKEVLKEFDHKHLNLDTAYFRGRIPTTENIAGVLWDVLTRRPEIGQVHRIRLFEDEDLSADVTQDSLSATGVVSHARITRRYHFSSAHQVRSMRLSEGDNRRVFGTCSLPGGHGHDYVLSVTVGGEIDAETGMVVDIAALDRVVQDLVIARFDHRSLSEDPELSSRGATGEHITMLLWQLLVKAVPGGRLERVGLDQTREARYEYEGSAP